MVKLIFQFLLFQIILCQFACANIDKSSVASNNSIGNKTESDKMVQQVTKQNKSIAIINEEKNIATQNDGKIIPAAEQGDEYFPQLQNRNVALVVNHTSKVKDQHLVDYLIDNNIKLSSIFTPEHGFKGTADAGEKVYNDEYKNIPIISLYGKNKKPKAENLNGIDIIVFDMQDVGARFYTYISTMHYVMEAAAENNIAVMILDRPNPNGHYVDGPIREEEFKSFVGMHPIPIVHGMTVGELAKMINGEGWLKNNLTCNLSVIPVVNYTHNKPYVLPVKPSPNLPNQRSIYLYPSLCLFEGTQMSVGRGTQKQFQVIGHPELPETDYTFTPKSSAGAKYPKHENKVCQAIDLSTLDEKSLYKTQSEINLKWLISCYNQFPNKAGFFLDNGFFDKLAGTKKLKEQIIAGVEVEKIKASWLPELNAFKAKRKQYLLYPDFE